MTTQCEPSRSETLRAACISLLLTILFGGAAHAAQITAADCIKATGIKAGLAVHIGVTDGILEADLVATSQERLLVHGLSSSEKTIHESRQLLQAKGIYGLGVIQTRWLLVPRVGSSVWALPCGTGAGGHGVCVRLGTA